jgi:hypothetical protein
MRIFRTRVFSRFCAVEHIDDPMLRVAAERFLAGYIDADLGGGVYKQRIARANEGRSGGFRVIVAARKADRIVFVFGFAKSRRSIVNGRELYALRMIARTLLDIGDADLERALEAGELVEVS